MTVRPLTLSEAAAAFGGTLMYPDCHFQRVATDTRQLRGGELFVALRGERFDAHQFLAEAAAQACGLVVTRADKHLKLPQWIVPDTDEALGQLASLARDQFDGPVIAITGSSGKTTVKEMTAAILRGLGPVLATRGNLNNHIGLPLTLLGSEPEHRFAVLEMGASAAGEIAWLGSIARPTVALITNVLPAHVAGFGSLAGVAAAKGEIYAALGAKGTAVLNLDIDSRWLSEWRASLPCLEVLTFSLTRPDADVGAKAIAIDTEGCASFRLRTPLGETAIRLQVAGRHNVANALAAATCALAAGAGLDAMAAGLRAVLPAPGRMQTRRGRNGARVIDDSYNANPGSVKAALDALANFPGRRLLVLGDMAELGKDAQALHREVGAYAAARGIDALYACGPLSALAAATFGAGGRAFADKTTLTQALIDLLAPDTTVLVKGSRSAGMEDVARQLDAGEEAGAALVK
ncbi:MAG: UDP-N-acetylmuramoyl-tripeptide--D-alanyl-D-alanine ligase [Porticoccaceae bacterium]